MQVFFFCNVLLKQHINTNAADLSHVDSISAAFSTPSFLIFRTVSLQIEKEKVMQAKSTE